MTHGYGSLPGSRSTRGRRWIGNTMIKRFGLDQRASRASLRKPREIAFYSVGDNGQFHVDHSQLKYYCLGTEDATNLDIDLNEGFDTWVQKDPSVPVHMEGFLQALEHYERSRSSRVNANMVMWRGIARSIMVLPYERRNNVNVNLTFFDGQVFAELDHESELKRDSGGSDMNCYFGYKFEKVALSKTPRGPADTHERANQNEQFCSIVRTGVGDLRLILAGEVDGAFDQFELQSEDPLEHYVELKTSAVVTKFREARKFETKLLVSWAQSFLLGIPRIIYGFRDQNRLVATEIFATESIPSLIKHSEVSDPSHKWNGQEAICFYAAALDMIFQHMKSCPPQSVWRLSYTAGQDHLCISPAPSHVPFFLNDSFVKWRESLP